MPTARNECFAVLLGDNLYVFGGYDSWSMQALSIPPPPCVPAIVVQPSPVTVQVGSAATFCVSATGAQPLHYQWWFNQTNLVAGGTNYSLTLVNVQTSNSGLYSVAVSNAYGSTTSMAAMLTVTVPPDSDGDGLSDDYERGVGRYFLIATNLTWTQAKADAERRGGHLATITSQAEWDAILQVLGSSLNGRGVWLGATDEEVEGTWRWITGETWAYTRWHTNPQQPDNAGGIQHYLWLHPGYGLNWDDNEGTSVADSYLLEFGYYTDPNNPDTDGDGFTDGDEVAAGSSPVDANDTPPGRFNQFTLSATTPGGGLVIPNPLFAGYPSNRLVTLTATAASGWTFLGWQGDAAGGNATHTFTMSRPRCVQGFFGTAINRSVIGSGAVTLLPQAALYPYGASVKLVAEPQPGNFFAHWTNSVGGGQNPRTFTVNSANPLITAVFAPLSAGQFALTTIPNGPGRITVTPQTNRYPNGASVTIRAIPDAGQSFTGWSGDAGGALSPLTLTMDQSRVITATFSRRPRVDAVNCLGEIRTTPFVLSIAGELGERYEVQCSTDLMGWSPLATVTNALGTAQWSDANGTNAAQRFYRATLAQ